MFAESDFHPQRLACLSTETVEVHSAPAERRRRVDRARCTARPPGRADRQPVAALGPVCSPASGVNLQQIQHRATLAAPLAGGGDGR
jgi:hypothetical protein